MRRRSSSRRLSTTVSEVSRICENAGGTDKEVEPVDQYLKSFHWNKVKYRADKPLGNS